MKQTEIDIGFGLLMRYKKPVVPLSDVVADFMPHLTLERANKRANIGTLPFPAFRADGSKSPFFVHLSDIANWLEVAKSEQSQDWHNLRQ